MLIRRVRDPMRLLWERIMRTWCTSNRELLNKAHVNHRLELPYGIRVIISSLIFTAHYMLCGMSNLEYIFSICDCSVKNY